MVYQQLLNTLRILSLFIHVLQLHSIELHRRYVWIISDVTQIKPVQLWFKWI